MPTFDPNVFDFGTFDALFGIPLLLKVDVPLECRKVKSGQVVVINVYIVDVSNPLRKFLFNPTLPPRISIFYPDKTPKVISGVMINKSIGVYQYIHQTGVTFDSMVFDIDVFDVVNNDPLGVYTAIFNAADGNSTMNSLPQEIYEVVS